MTQSPFATMLDALTRQRGVVAALVADERDGIVIDSRVHVGQRGDRVAALAASLYRKARMSAHAAGLGDVGFLQLEAEMGRVCAVGRDDVVLVAVATSDANVGLIRVELLRALEGLA
ncbi:MAG: roadblock/LC7 domain-containing protein [Gemmatimonadaceae bacterium]|nr:roadblock/LC7 domain-containing protein [Gemmatimonadaceae bacterium]